MHKGGASPSMPSSKAGPSSTNVLARGLHNANPHAQLCWNRKVKFTYPDSVGNGNSVSFTCTGGGSYSQNGKQGYMDTLRWDLEHVLSFWVPHQFSPSILTVD